MWGDVTFLWEEKLVDYDVVRVDFVGCELLDKALCFVEGEELGDADADERCLFLVVSCNPSVAFSESCVTWYKPGP